MQQIIKRFTLLIIFLSISLIGKAQEKPSASKAFLKSIVLPGWGHFGLDKQHHVRGQWHLGAEVALWLTYFGVDSYNGLLQQNLYAHTELNAGVDIKGRDRTFQLALANYNSLDDYNQAQEFSRNWGGFLSDSPQNQWQWETQNDRFKYVDMRNRIESNKNQLPFIITMMVGNRILSALSAFSRANEKTSTPDIKLSSRPQWDNSLSTELTVRIPLN